MRAWFQEHSIVGTSIALLSLGTPEALSILASQIFGSTSEGATFNAPMSAEAKQRFSWFGLAGNVLEDIPQMSLQLVSLIFEFNLEAVVI